MKILYLYSELSAYNIPVIKIFVEIYAAEVHIVSWDKNKLKPYSPPEIENVFYYRRSEYDKKSILKLSTGIDPDIIYISGWMDKAYFPTAKLFKSKGIPVVTGFDDQWIGSLRQQAGRFIFSILYQRYYSHAWVAGPRQFEFAKKLGFKNKDIVFDLLSCNVDLFKSAQKKAIDTSDSYPKAFLYVGNFRLVKGLDILIDAFKIYRDLLNGQWRLICVGNGELKSIIDSEACVDVFDFSDQKTLLEFCSNSGVFVLPSRHDQWGVVVHEFATAGLPLLLADGVGAKSTFFIEDFNGISFSNNSPEELAAAMLRFSQKSDAELMSMGENSRILSERITPLTSAANFISLINSRVAN